MLYTGAELDRRIRDAARCRMRLRCLAANLAAVAGLDLARRFGFVEGAHFASTVEPLVAQGEPWHPGSQRPAPGWGGK